MPPGNQWRAGIVRANSYDTPWLVTPPAPHKVVSRYTFFDLMSTNLHAEIQWMPGAISQSNFRLHAIEGIRDVVSKWKKWRWSRFKEMQRERGQFAVATWHNRKNRADLNQYWWSCEMMNREFLDWVPPPYSDPVDVQLPHIFCTPLPQPVPHTSWFYSYWHKHSTFTYSCMMSAADSVPCCSSKAIFSTSVSIAAMTSRWQRSTSQLTRRDREAMTECTSANCVV